ncbi:hypothetical protein Y032_0002g565 [Ancylostoma ceylanicum]|uniref:Uncharacterized protein n=1 Tax=Ancylostoma ceylanicum TaxID=53326 RepID=A0A016W241_9BILA|nr:hypothetical protein Y032_0002g565 [Ancylostoma ceylanicum]
MVSYYFAWGALKTCFLGLFNILNTMWQRVKLFPKLLLKLQNYSIFTRSEVYFPIGRTEVCQQGKFCTVRMVKIP